MGRSHPRSLKAPWALRGSRIGWCISREHWGGAGEGGWLPEGPITTEQLASGAALTNSDVSSRISWAR